MKFGICTTLDHAPAAKAAGWDYIEESTQNFLKGLTPDPDWHGPELLANSPLKVLACNLLVPASIKVTGPDASAEKHQSYMANVTRRAAKAGVKILVFGSAGARNIPEGFDMRISRKQLIDFLGLSAELAEEHGVTIVVEPLNKKESNIFNTVGESVQYIDELNHPNLKCLVDSYHFWLEEEPLENLKRAMPKIAHVHLADKEGRVAPGESKKSDYRPFFHVLKEGNYQGLISVEAPAFDIKTQGTRVLDFLRTEWNAA